MVHSIYIYAHIAYGFSAPVYVSYLANRGTSEPRMGRVDVGSASLTSSASPRSSRYHSRRRVGIVNLYTGVSLAPIRRPIVPGTKACIVSVSAYNRAFSFTSLTLSHLRLADFFFSCSRDVSSFIFLFTLFVMRSEIEPQGWTGYHLLERRSGAFVLSRMKGLCVRRSVYIYVCIHAYIYTRQERLDGWISRVYVVFFNLPATWCMALL